MKTCISVALSFALKSLMIAMTACSAADDGSATPSQPGTETDIVAQDSAGLRIDIEAIDAERVRFSVPEGSVEELRALLQDLALTKTLISKKDGIAAAIVPLSSLPASADASESGTPGVQPLGLFSKKWFKIEYTTLEGTSGCEDHQFRGQLQAVYFWSHVLVIMKHASISKGQCPEQP